MKVDKRRMRDRGRHKRLDDAQSESELVVERSEAGGDILSYGLVTEVDGTACDCAPAHHVAALKRWFTQISERNAKSRADHERACSGRHGFGHSPVKNRLVDTKRPIA